MVRTACPKRESLLVKSRNARTAAIVRQRWRWIVSYIGGLQEVFSNLQTFIGQGAPLKLVGEI